MKHIKMKKRQMDSAMSYGGKFKTPLLLSDGSYSVGEGIYSRIGNTVTFSIFVPANTRVIQGLPFTKNIRGAE